MNRKIRIALAMVLLACLLAACSKKQEAPAAYKVGEDEVVSLDSIMGEGEAVLTSVEEPTEAALEEGEEKYVYHYRQSADPAKLAAEYIGVLRGSEQGFSLVDLEHRKLAEEPSLDTLTGEIVLAKKSAGAAEGESKLFRVIVAWSEFALAVEVSQQAGSILPPIVEEEQQEEEFQPTAILEQVDYFNSLKPWDIGLEGDDMGDYKVYPKQGWVLVDSFSCREMDVYLEDVRDGSNAYMGTYFLSSDLQHLYQKDSNGQIVPIDLK